MEEESIPRISALVYPKVKIMGPLGHPPSRSKELLRSAIDLAVSLSLDGGKHKTWVVSIWPSWKEPKHGFAAKKRRRTHVMRGGRFSLQLPESPTKLAEGSGHGTTWLRQK